MNWFLLVWLAWFAGGLWLTVRAITSNRDFLAWEIIPAIFCCAIAGPIIALGWGGSVNDRPRVLFPRRR